MVFSSMSHRTWWLVSIFSLIIGAAMEFDITLPLPQAADQSASTPADSVVAQKSTARRS